MKQITNHIIIPLILPAVFFVVVLLPVDLFGCRMRGLIAAGLAIAAGVLGIVAAVKALLGKVRGDTQSFLWMASALILAIPVFFIVLVAT